jgi:hypothetical protein
MRPASASTARSSIGAGLISRPSPAPLRIFALASLLEARTSGRLSSQSGTLYVTGRRRRSVNSRITAAAVSSIERRVTSIDGQLCLAQSRRE